jgi:hypothetical protein
MSFLFEYGANGPISARVRQQKAEAGIADSAVKGPSFVLTVRARWNAAGLSV